MILLFIGKWSLKGERSYTKLLSTSITCATDILYTILGQQSQPANWILLFIIRYICLLCARRRVYHLDSSPTLSFDSWRIDLTGVLPGLLRRHEREAMDHVGPRHDPAYCDRSPDHRRRVCVRLPQPRDRGPGPCLGKSLSLRPPSHPGLGDLCMYFIILGRQKEAVSILLCGSNSKFFVIVCGKKN